jgi:hypothetical protein
MTPDLFGTDRKPETGEKTPHLKISILVSQGYGEARCIDDVSDHTAILAIRNDIDAFDEAFQRDFCNSKLTKSEKDVLRTYLWWRTKKHTIGFSQELGGMVINEHGAVGLTAADIRISKTISEDGYRIYENIIVLTARGKEDHDKLVEAWMKWKESTMVLTGTVVCDHPCCFSRSRFLPVPQEEMKNKVESASTDPKVVPGYAGDPP